MINNPWDPHLCLKCLHNERKNLLLDFNRLRYLHIPLTRTIQGCGKLTFAHRDPWVRSMISALKQRNDLSSATKGTLFTFMISHTRLCDRAQLTPFSAEAVQLQAQFFTDQNRKGKLKDTSLVGLRSQLSSCLNLLGLPAEALMSDVPVFSRLQRVPVQGYSTTELRRLLPLLRGMFKQLSGQFIADPAKHINAYRTTPSMHFNWQGVIYPVCGGISKLMCCALYLLAYYTWSNTSVLLSLKRPHNSARSVSESWYRMPAFKRRAFRTVTVYFTGHDHLDIPKYSLQFFDQLTAVSRLLSDEPETFLLKTAVNGKIVPFPITALSTFNRRFISGVLGIKDDSGAPLHLTAARFRATGSMLSLTRYDPLQTSVLLDNTPAVVNTHYASGNKHDNNRMLRDVTAVLEYQSRHRSGIEAAEDELRKQLDIPVLTYKAYLESVSRPLRSAHGCYCSAPEGTESRKFTLQSLTHQLVGNGELLACASLLNCFACRHQVLVESETDIWCLLSFRDTLRNSREHHLNLNHYQKNFLTLLSSLDERIILLNTDMVRRAERRLKNHGPHPLWTTE